MTWHDSVPKVELHVHLEGAIPHEGLFDLIQKYGGDRSVPDAAALAKRFQYKDFRQFIETWSWKNQFLADTRTFRTSPNSWPGTLSGKGFGNAEMFFSPSLFVRVGSTSRSSRRRSAPDCRERRGSRSA